MIFSRYDEGIWMTDDIWFGITPEPVRQAHHRTIRIAGHTAGFVVQFRF